MMRELTLRGLVGTGVLSLGDLGLSGQDAGELQGEGRRGDDVGASVLAIDADVDFPPFRTGVHPVNATAASQAQLVHLDHRRHHTAEARAGAR